MSVQGKDYFSTREAAELLGVAVSTIQLWSNNGLLQARTTVGGHRRIERDSVNKMLTQQHAVSNEITKQQSLSIVVIEDSEQDLQLYEKLFEHWKINANVVLSRDGYEGLINIGRLSPDIIIVDLMISNIDGFEIIKKIREDAVLTHCLIIVVSEFTKDEIKIKGGLPEDVHVFSKTPGFNELEKLIREEKNYNVDKMKN